MKGFIKWAVIVSAIFAFLLSCRGLKINPSDEKIGVLGKDYVVVKYEKKEKEYFGGHLILNVFYIFDEEIVSLDYFIVTLNNIISVFDNDKKPIYRVMPNKKYNIDVVSLGFKEVKIPNLLVRENDSIVVNVYLKERNVVYE